MKGSPGPLAKVAVISVSYWETHNASATMLPGKVDGSSRYLWQSCSSGPDAKKARILESSGYCGFVWSKDPSFKFRSARNEYVFKSESVIIDVLIITNS